MAGKKQLEPVPLRSVGEQSFSDAIRDGDRLDELRAMLRVLSAHIDSENTLARDLAALMRQAREISKEIEELEAKQAAEEEEELGVVIDISDEGFDYSEI